MLVWWEEMFLRGKMRFQRAQGLLSAGNELSQSFSVLPLPPSALTFPFLACGKDLLMSQSERSVFHIKKTDIPLCVQWGYLLRAEQDVCGVCLSQLSLLWVTQRLINSVF